MLAEETNLSLRQTSRVVGIQSELRLHLFASEKVFGKCPQIFMHQHVSRFRLELEVVKQHKKINLGSAAKQLP